MRTALALVATMTAAASGSAPAATKVATFQVGIAIQSSCTVASASGLVVASPARVSVTGAGQLAQVNCTLPVPYSTTVKPASVAFHGRVPAQSAPAADTYADTIVVTVTF